MKLMKEAKAAYIAVSAVIIVLGFVFVLFPQISALAICYIVGAGVTVFGIVKLIGYFSKDPFRLAFQFDFALGIFAIIAGVLMLIHPVNIVKSVPIIIGVFIIMDGAFKLQTAFDAKAFGMSAWWSILCLAILTCLGGLALVINPFESAAALIILLGITLIIDGIQNLCVTAYTVKIIENKDRSYSDDYIINEKR